jgi:diguanylate cyclase (GGDEF)-like protein
MAAGRTVVSRQEELLSSDFSPDPLSVRESEGGVTELAVPLVGGRQSPGALVLGWRTEVNPSNNQVWLAEALAGYAATILDNAHAHAESERRRAQAEALAELVRLGATERDPEQAIMLVCGQARSLVGSDYAGVVLIEGDGTRVWRGTSDGRTPVGPIPSRGRGTGPTSRALAAGRPIVLERLDEQPDASLMHAREGGRTALAVPFTARGGLKGALHLGWRTDMVPTPTQVRLAEALAGYAATVLENAGAHAALAHQALYDSLTGLPNRRLFEDRLAQSILASQRDGYPLALLLMDLDRFKDVNDNLGHLAGDRVLQEVARRLRAALRGSDTVCRLGGDEFAMLLWNVKGTQGAAVAARKVVEAVREPYLLGRERVYISASIGIALSPEHGEDGETLLRRADVAMYTAKRARSGYSVFAPEMDRDREDPELAEGLRRARPGRLRGQAEPPGHHPSHPTHAPN